MKGRVVMSKFVCPKCGFKSHVEEAEFCQECGTYLLNRCTNEQCTSNQVDVYGFEGVPTDAKFCPYCGSETTFKQDGYFDKE